MPDILISMNKTTEKLWKYADEWEKTPEHFDGVNPFCVAIHAVRQMTNAPELPNEQKHGHWIADMYDFYPPVIICSVCGCEFDAHVAKHKYCPECGAKMDEKMDRMEVKQDD